MLRRPEMGKGMEIVDGDQEKGTSTVEKVEERACTYQRVPTRMYIVLIEAELYRIVVMVLVRDVR